MIRSRLTIRRPPAPRPPGVRLRRRGLGKPQRLPLRAADGLVDVCWTRRVLPDYGPERLRFEDALRWLTCAAYRRRVSPRPSDQEASS